MGLHHTLVRLSADDMRKERPYLILTRSTAPQAPTPRL